MTNQNNDFSDLLRDVLEQDRLGRRALFEGFLNQQNQQQQAGFGIPSFGDGGIKVTPMPMLPIDPGFDAPNQGGATVDNDKTVPDVGNLSVRQAGGGGFLQNQRSFLSGLFQPTFNKFLGQIGESVNSGQAPTNTFSEFFQQQFNPQRELARATQRQQGINTGNIRGSGSRLLAF